MDVVLDGDRVHRPAGPWTPSVHALLRHVRARGVPGVPEPLGIDGDREAVAFVAGEVPAYPMPAWAWEKRVLDGAARWLRRFHEATLDFPRAGRVWRLPAHEPVEVVCHNDLAPYNLVFRDGEVAGAIDFDAASPGPRAWDLAYLAYRTVPLAAPGNPDLPASPEPERRARLRRLCESYGGVAPEAVLALLPARLDELAAFTEARGGGFAAHARLYHADADYARGLGR